MTKELSEDEAVKVTAFGLDKPPTLKVITAGELSANDIGSRVVTSRDGATVDGNLTKITAWQYSTKLYFSIEITAGSTVAAFKDIPVDYSLQIEAV